jgi:hypothetical protein
MNRWNLTRLAAPALLALAVAVLTTGCPGYIPGPGGGGSQTAYDNGFDAGFLIDDWYWDGYYDGYDTVDVAPVYYDTTGIPYIDELTYDAGYWDGVWTAYNDGYFVDYHYAFVVGFSEGYDNAFWPDYLDFLDSDVHYEYGHGGWADGYNDGFSEGRVFGAYDYEAGLPFDWVDAILDYETGTDLYFDEVGYGTGTSGPVILYEYGTDPLAKKARVRPAADRPRTIREGSLLKSIIGDYTRPLRAEAQVDLQTTPATSLRSDRALRLDTTWLNRVETYSATGAAKSARVSPRTSRVPIN